MPLLNCHYCPCDGEVECIPAWHQDVQKVFERDERARVLNTAKRLRRTLAHPFLGIRKGGNERFNRTWIAQEP